MQSNDTTTSTPQHVGSTAELGGFPAPVATIANDGHPRHIGHVWGIGETRLYGPPRNLYREDQLKAYAAAAVAAERERWEQERKVYRSLLAQARVVLRGPHTEQNIVVRELVARIESRGVNFDAEHRRPGAQS